MPRIKVQAQELHDVDVTHISLVQRGANRVPFRIVKNADGQEKTAMLNFRALFKTDPPKPQIAAVVVSKTLSQAAATRAVEKAGFATDRLDAGQDGAYIFAQHDGDVEHGVLLKMDDHLALVVTGDAITKALETYNFETTSFSEIMAQEGFVPSFGMATDMLKSVVMNMVSKAENRDELVTAMESAVDEFGDFVTALARSVPEDAFRAEFMKYDEVDGEDRDVPPDDADAGEPGAKAKSYKDKGKGGKKKADAPDDADGSEAGDDADPEAKAKSESAEDGAQDDEGDRDAQAGADVAAAIKDALSEALAPLSKTIADLDKTVGAQGKALKEVSARAEKAEEAATKATKAVRGKVNGSAAPDPTEESRRKGDDAAYADPPLIDTAYARFSEARN